MKQFITIFLTITVFICKGQSNELDRLEIWGWDGGKQEFRDLYFEKIGVDLANSSACAVDLKSLGFKNARSIIFIDPENFQEFLAGVRNWEKIDRLVIIREFPETRFSTLMKDTILQNRIEQVIDILKLNPELLNEKSAKKEFSNFELLMVGAINSANNQLRDNSNSLLEELCIENLEYGDNTFELLAIMLETPDPFTCYNAMAIIRKLSNKTQITGKIDFRAARTLRDFVFSDLQTFQPDAIEFLTELYPERDNWILEKWKEWFEGE